VGSVITPLCSRRSEYLTLRARHLDGGACWVLELSGEADIATLGLLRQELAHLATRNPGDAVVDVARLEFCDVASAQLILGARRRIPSTLRGATGSVKRVFDLLDALQRQRLPHYLAAGQPGRSSSSRSSARPPLTGSGCGGELGVAPGVGDHGVGHVAEPVLVAARVVAHEVEGGIDVDGVGPGQHPLGLLDGDPAVQGAL
jgi:anti-anti-sigma regulatory factor